MRLPYACVLGVFLAACCSPRYTYYFPQPGSLPIELASGEQAVRINPPDKQALQASAEKIAAPSVQIPKTSHVSQKPPVTPAFAPTKITRTQPLQGGPPDTASLSDSTFRLSLIFLIGGLFIWVIGGPVFTVIGSLAMLTGVVFGIKWFFKK